LPESLGQLKELTTLYAQDGELKVLPPALGGCLKLERVALQRNQLTSLPESLLHLKNLTHLLLLGNQRLNIPTEVLDEKPDRWGEGNARRVLHYYFSRHAQGAAPMKEVRLLLVGRGRVGKTSLLKVLRGEKPDHGEKETPGITVLPLEVKCDKGVARAYAWDFGGQEFLHGTHQIFLSERCVYLLVLEGRESNWEMETDYWLRFIQSYGGESPVIVALNKYALHSFSVDRFRLQERCPQIVGFVQTDTFTRRGIADLRRLIEETVNGMEHVWVGVPKKWHRVKEELTRMPESFLEYGDYQVLCSKFGIDDEGPQASLAETLHRLGIALNFRDHHRLRETSVLKPQWVTEGIYGLLRHAQKKDCHGVLLRKWIGEALPTKDYPLEKHGFVMELMEKFEVAFALEDAGEETSQPEEPERWLIPELLREEQPAAFTEFRESGVKRLRFSYPQALPPGLLPRLIVRTHEMSEGHADWRWRSGVVLEWNGAQALVRLDRSERQTEVAVRGGTEADQQSLFDIIRAHLTVLHGNVKAVEEVQAIDDPEKWVEMRELRQAEVEKDTTIKVSVSDDPGVPRVKLPVVETRRKVESDEAAKAAGPEAEARMQLFISYAHANAKALQPFHKHLTLLSQRGYIQVWHDRDLVPGELFQDRIVEELSRADLVLIFYTIEARNSEFIQKTELPLALERSDAGKCSLLWVPLDRPDLDEKHLLETRLAKIQCAVKDRKPIYKHKPQRDGWMEVEQAIRRAVEARRKLGGRR